MHSPILDIYAAGHSASSPPVPEGCSHIYAPCLDPNCERDCGAHRPYTDRARAITADMVTTKHRGFIEIFGLLLGFGIAVSMCVGVAVQGAENWHQTIIQAQEE